MDQEPSEDLQPRKQVRLRLRPDLVIVRLNQEDSTHYVIKDPAGLRYLQFDDQDYFLIKLMDGTNTTEDLRVAFEKRFPPQLKSLEEVEALCQRLLQGGLIAHDSKQAGQQLYERHQKRRRREWLQILTNPLFVKVPVCDPSHVLDRLLPYVRWLFTTWFLVASAIVFVAALLMVGSHFDSFWRKLPSYHEFFSFKNVVYLWAALAIVKMLHEFGHGLCCKYYGGEVHDLGLLVMCLTPCLYMNVSDSWTLPSKWKRIHVAFAGIFVELWIATLATFIWWHTHSQDFLYHLCLSLMVVCSFNTIFVNGNPLLRYDGYYILADWLEIPNLRERCNAFIKNLFLQYGLGIQVSPERPMTLWRRIWFVLFAVASYVYVWVVTLGAIFFVSGFLPYKLKIIGVLMGWFAVGSMVGWPLYRLGKNLYDRGRLPDMKPKNVLSTASIVAGLLLVFFFLPLPISRVRQQAVVQLRPEAAAKVFVPHSASLIRLHIGDGQQVQEGDILADFRSLEMENQWEEARAQHRIRVMRLLALRRQASETKDAQERAKIDTNIAQTEGERQQYAQQMDLQQQNIDSLTLKAPRSGIVMSPPRLEDVGKLWDKDQGVPFCTIGDPSKLRVLVPVKPADFRLLQEDSGRDLAATMRLQGWLGQTWRGKVAPLPESEAQEVPPALTTRHGGPLTVKAASRPGAYAPQSQQYLVAVDFLEVGKDRIWPGTLGQVKIHVKYKTLAWWLWRTISSAFDLGLVG